MSKIEIRVIDSAGNVATLPLPNDKPLLDLIPAVITLLDLTSNLDYRVFSPRFQRVLSLSGTLYSNGIQDGDTLRVLTVPASIHLELEILEGPDRGVRLPFPQQALVKLGRGSDNDIVIRHNAISRYHGEFAWVDGLHIYRDLNSANGSFLNNQVVSEPIPISPGSILALGENIRLIYQESAVHYDSQGESTVVSAGHSSQTITKLNPLPNGIIFMNYPEEEVSVVRHLIQAIRDQNFHVFWKAEIPPDSNYTEALNNALNVSDTLLAIITPAALEDSALVDQWNAFFLERKPMIAILYKGNEVPHIFDDHIKITFEGDIHRLTNEIVKRLSELLR